MLKKCDKWYELEGIIKQPVIKPPDEEMRPLSIQLNDSIINGTHGSGSWWLPIDNETGIKVINSIKNSSYDAIINRKKSQENIINKFYETCKHSYMHIPKILDIVIVKYSGLCEMGGTKRKGNYDLKDMFMLSFIMKRYKTQYKGKLYMDDECEYINEKFKKDGVVVAGDAFVWRQLGIKNDTYVLLDIETAASSKFYPRKKII